MGNNLDFAKLKQTNPELYKKFIMLPSVQTKRAFTLDNIEETIQEIDPIMKKTVKFEPIPQAVSQWSSKHKLIK